MVAFYVRRRTLSRYVLRLPCRIDIITAEKSMILDELNTELDRLQTAIVEHEQRSRRIRDLESDLTVLYHRRTELSAVLRKEEADVDRLEGLSLRGMFLAVFGDKESTLERENSEFFAAWLKLDQLEQAIEISESELNALRAQHTGEGDLEEKKIRLLNQKERVLIEVGDEVSSSLIALSEKRSQLLATRKELDEAMREGTILQDALNAMVKDLSNARGWGTFDMLGGGLIATAIKHSRIDDARSKIAGVQAQLNRFRREMADVNMEADINIEIGGFTTFADYFFDNLIVDWVVQSQISRSLAQVNTTMSSITKCLRVLGAKREENRRQEVEIIRKRSLLLDRS
jgi:hypothetical protein